jgi:hypothetical protein
VSNLKSDDRKRDQRKKGNGFLYPALNVNYWPIADFLIGKAELEGLMGS